MAGGHRVEPSELRPVSLHISRHADLLVAFLFGGLREQRGENDPARGEGEQSLTERMSQLRKSTSIDRQRQTRNSVMRNGVKMNQEDLRR